MGYFERFINKQFEEGKIKTTEPNSSGEVMVCCPFPHKTISVNEDDWSEEVVTYYEENASSSINLDKRVFHCLACREGHSEVSFAAKLTGKSKSEVKKDIDIIDELQEATFNWVDNQHISLLKDDTMLESLNNLNVGLDLVKNINLGKVGDMLAIPCFINGVLDDVVRYNIYKIPDKNKAYRNKNSVSGNIIPYDIWKKSKDTTIICEGEKDMLVARSYGYNAISITGGAGSSIKQELEEDFKDRDVYIVFDNDEAGRQGALNLYQQLKHTTSSVKIANIGGVVEAKGEDVADFFLKYNKEKEDFDNLLKIAEEPEKEVLENTDTPYDLKLSTFVDNLKDSQFRKDRKSKVQIIATSLDTFSVNEYVSFIPKNQKQVEQNDAIADLVNSNSKNWYLHDNLHNFLELIEMRVKSKDLNSIFARVLNISHKEYKNYDIKKGPMKTVYKYTAADEVGEHDEYASELTLDLYTFEPLQIGDNYEITYRLYPHPKDGQKTVAIATNIKSTNMALEVIDKKVVESLEKFQVETTVEEKVEALFQSARQHIAPYLHRELWLLSELVFNSPLDFIYLKPLRGVLDVFVVGDTRTGKSETTRALRDMYDFGSVIPLKTATTQSLIGGTNETTKKTKLGTIPRNHKELVILEEFSGAPEGFMKTMTEIRSSNIVKLYRVGGDLKAPCKLRMITISNPLSKEDGIPRLLSVFPNGVEPIIELVSAPEDIARYDAFLLVPQVTHRTNPFDDDGNNYQKIDTKHYKTKVKWIQSLNTEDIIIKREVGKYIFQKSEELNEIYESNFTLFGSETDKKIARFTVALACMLVSTKDYEKVEVTKEHVDCVVNFFHKLYDNKIFRLKEYTEEQKSYSKTNEKDTDFLEEAYPKNTTILDILFRKSRISRHELLIASGQERGDFSRIFNSLVARKFVKIERDQVIPTTKFRKTFNKIKKDFTLNDTGLVNEDDLPF